MAVAVAVAFFAIERWLDPPALVTGAASATGVNAEAGGDGASTDRLATAPLFTLPPLLGGTKARPVQLSDWHGKPVIISFYASWCEACRAERPVLMRLRDRVGAAAMLSIGTMDDASALRAQEVDEPHGYPVALDERGDVARAFGIDALPQTYLVAGNGKILHHVYGALTETDIEEFTRRAGGG